MYHIPSIRSKDFVHRAVIIKNETFPIDPEKIAPLEEQFPLIDGGHLLSFTFTSVKNTNKYIHLIHNDKLNHLI